MEDNALVIFVRNPVSGKVKTRIAKTIGDDKALRVYHILLKHTCSIAKQVMCDRYVFYSDHIPDNDLWDRALYGKEIQRGTHLGQRMQGAFDCLFNKGYVRVTLIGSDCYDLTSGIIQHSFSVLKHHDLVIGPSYDGGYYLIGMQPPVKDVFEDISWSTSTVFKETMSKITANRNTVSTLPLLNDVDEEKDISFEY